MSSLYFRVMRYLLPHRMLLAAVVAASLMFAALDTLSFVLIFPFLETLFGSEQINLYGAGPQVGWILENTIGRLVQGSFDPMRAITALSIAVTEMRSKTVSRKKLSEIAYKMGIQQHLTLDDSVKSNKAAIRGISGNALEALIGAVYLDRGYMVTKKFIEKKIILPHLDFEHLKEHTENFKSILNQWAQKSRKELVFKVMNESGKNHSKIYTVSAMLDGEEAGTAQGPSKKRAEQLASEMACKKLKINYSPKIDSGQARSDQ
jgi:hypothetical protein